MSIFGLMSLHSFMLVLVCGFVNYGFSGRGDIHVHATRAAWDIPAEEKRRLPEAITQRIHDHGVQHNLD